MGLMVCPDCGKQHSDAAPLCPQCGRPQRRDAHIQRQTLAALPVTKLAGVVLAQKYQLDELIGRGGMAVVYRCTHLQLGQQVAVKIIYRHLAEDRDIQQRFRKEAQIQFSLQHPGLVRVLDLIDEPGLLGMALDWIEGQSLLQWMRRRTEPPTPEDILRLYIPILQALGYAHAHHVIHRDIKPDNILLSGPPGQEIPKITDFGIAKILNDRESTQTHSNAPLGTPTYMSPEQVDGLRKLDHRVDIYALGVLLFALATGRPPFKGITHTHTAAAHLSQPVPLLRSVYKFADERLDPIIAKAMAKDPDHRYPSCEAFAEALKAALIQTNSEAYLTEQNTGIDLDETPEDLSLQWINDYALADSVAHQHVASLETIEPSPSAPSPVPSQPLPAQDLADATEPRDAALPEHVLDAMVPTLFEGDGLVLPIAPVAPTPVIPVAPPGRISEEDARTIISDDDNMLERMLQVRMEERLQLDQTPFSPPTLTVGAMLTSLQPENAPPDQPASQPVSQRTSRQWSWMLALPVIVCICIVVGLVVWWFWFR